MLLADSKSRAWDFSNSIRDYIKTIRGVDVPLEEIVFQDFRNGEFLPRADKNLRKKDVYFIHDSSKNPARWWVELLLVKDMVLRASANSISFVLPNMDWSRQDCKDKPHVPISARVLADTISPGLSRIITMDLHSKQVQGFYPQDCPLDNLDSTPTILKYLRKNTGDIEDLRELIIFSPDAGGVPRAEDFAEKLGSRYPIAFTAKRRKTAGEVASMRLSGDVEGKDVLSMDDMYDSTNTNCEAGEVLIKHGAQRLFTYATHGLFTKGTERICKLYKRVMTSNTIYQQNGEVEVLDVSPIFAEAIYRAQRGESISSLFKKD